MIKKIWLIAYILLAKWLPVSWQFRPAKTIRVFFARRVLKSAGTNINIERGASFASDVIIGNNSAIGTNCCIHRGGVKIGDNVLMGPDILIYTSNHESSRIDIPICKQGDTQPNPVVIEDDVWIGARVIILPGVTVKRGSIIGAGTVLTKTFPEYSIIAGNPGKVVKSRKNEIEK